MSIMALSSRSLRPRTIKGYNMAFSTADQICNLTEKLASSARYWPVFRHVRWLWYGSILYGDVTMWAINGTGSGPPSPSEELGLKAIWDGEK